jgi:hypothetical protein
LCIASNSCVPRSAPRSQQVGPAHPHDPRTSPRYGRFFSPTSPVEEEIDRFKYPAGQLHVISWFVACSIPPSGPLNERPIQRNERTILYLAARKIDSLCNVVARGRGRCCPPTRSVRTQHRTPQARYVGPAQVCFPFFLSHFISVLNLNSFKFE